MIKLVFGIVAVACVVSLSAFGQNKVVFDNQAGEPALVKLIGPTKTEVQVQNAAKTGVDATAGKYTIMVRYGTPGNYRYSKGQEFEVTETATARSETTITLHKVIAGNYDSQPISEADFGTSASSTKPPPDTAKANEAPAKGEALLTSTDESWRNDMAVFASAVAVIAAKSDVPDEIQLTKSISSRHELSLKDGTVIWVILPDGLGKELHGELAKTFTGKVSWTGKVTSAEVDKERQTCSVKVEFPKAKSLPNNIELSNASLGFSFDKLPSNKQPAVGSTFAFTGKLQKAEPAAISDSVFVLYGRGPNAGKIRIGVSIVDETPTGK